MKTCHLLILFALCAIIFATLMWRDEQALPPQIASHFDLNGNGDSPESRDIFFPFALATGLGVPLLILVLTYAIRFLPGFVLNVPHANYWRAPENRHRACAIVFHFAIGFVCGFVLWWTVFFHLVATANLVTPPHLDTSFVNLSAGIFLGCVAAWITLLYRAFKHGAASAKPVNRAPI